MLIPVMTVAENIVLAEEPTHAGGFLDLREANRRVSEISRALRPRRRSEGDGRRTSRSASSSASRSSRPSTATPTSSCSTSRPPCSRPQEAKELFQIIRGLTEQGKSIIFISHKLNEVTEVADRITVLRRGKLIETLPAEGATEEGLARLMVGREVLLRVEKGAGDARRDRCSRSTTCTSSTTAASRRCAASRSRCGPGRSSASPASTATGRRS